MSRKHLHILAFLSLVGVAFAQTASNVAVAQYLQTNVFGESVIGSAAVSDPSHMYLGLIFGSISGLQGQSAIISTMFRILNIGVSLVLVLSVIFVGAFGLSTAPSEGGAIGSGRSSPFMVFRTVVGFALVMPTASGYSLVQKLVMKMILAGVLTANYGWDMLLSNFGTVTPPARPMPVSTIPDQTPLLTAVSWQASYDSASPFEYNLMSGEEDQSTSLLYKLNLIVVNALSVINSTRQLHAYWTPDSLNTSFYTTSRQVVTPSTGALERILDVFLRLHANNQVYTPKLFSLRMEATSADRANLTQLSRAVDSYLSRMLNAALQDYVLTLPGGVPQALNAASTGNAFYTRQAYSNAKRVFLSSLPVIPGSRTALSNDSWVVAASAWGWLGAGVYYLDFDWSLHNQGAAIRPVAPAVSIWMPSAMTVSSFEFVKPGTAADSCSRSTRATSNCWKLPSIRTGDPRPGSSGNVNPPRSPNAPAISIRWLQELSTALNTDTWGVGSAAAPRSLGLSDEMKNNLKPSAAPTGFEVNAPTALAAGAFDINHNKPLEEMGVMSSAVLDAILSSDGIAGGTTNPLRSSITMGNSIMAAAKQYWRNTTEEIYQEIKDAQDAAYGVTAAALIAKGAFDALLSSMKERYIKEKERPMPAAGAAAAKAMPGFVIDPITDMVNVTTTIAKALLGVYLPLGNGLATVYFLAGAILGIYIPFIPAVIFIFSILAWFFAVIEAMVASPLIAIGVAHPEGHEVLGRAEQAIMLLVGVFLRPLLSLVGMLVALYFSHAALEIYNSIYLRMIPLYIQMQGADSLVQTEKLVRTFFASGLVVLYVYAMLVVVEQCFSLIYMVPDRVLRWLGGPSDAAGGGIGGALQSISAGLSQDVSSAGQQRGAATSGSLGQDTSIKS